MGAPDPPVEPADDEWGAGSPGSWCSELPSEPKKVLILLDTGSGGEPEARFGRGVRVDERTVGIGQSRLAMNAESIGAGS
jgi:hypothetical protein